MTVVDKSCATAVNSIPDVSGGCLGALWFFPLATKIGTVAVDSGGGLRGRTCATVVSSMADISVDCFGARGVFTLAIGIGAVAVDSGSGLERRTP